MFLDFIIFQKIFKVKKKRKKCLRNYLNLNIFFFNFIYYFLSYFPLIFSLRT